MLLAPISLANKLSEADLEALLIDNPALAGEPRLVLGSQLAEFAEDKEPESSRGRRMWLRVAGRGSA